MFLILCYLVFSASAEIVSAPAIVASDSTQGVDTKPRRGSRVGFAGVFDKFKKTEGIVADDGATSSIATARSARSARSVGTNVIAEDLSHYGKCLHKTINSSFVIAEQNQNLYRSKSYYSSLRGFYQELIQDVKTVSDLIKDASNLYKLTKKECETRGFRVWKAGPKNVEKVKLELDNHINDLKIMLQREPRFEETLMEPLREFKQFKEFMSEIADDDEETMTSLSPKDLVERIREFNRLATATNNAIRGVQKPFIQCFEEGRRLVDRISDLKAYGVDVDLSSTILNWSDDLSDKYYGLQLFTPIIIETPDKEAESDQLFDENNRKEPDQSMSEWKSSAIIDAQVSNGGMDPLS